MMGFVIALYVLNIIGAIWIGRKLEHSVIIPLAYIVIFVVLFKINEYVGVIALIVAALATLIAIIVMVVGLAKDKRQWDIQRKKDESFLDAVGKGDKEAVQVLLESGADVNFAYKGEKGALRVAVKNGDKEMVSLLLDKGADIKIERNLIDFAENNDEVISILKSHGAKTQDELEELAQLGDSYFEGNGVQKNYEKAVELYTEAANQGNVHGIVNLGTCYLAGDGVAKNEYEAFHLFRYAAEQEDMTGQSNLGFCYANGIGTTQDLTSASIWWSAAAKKGDSSAQYSLGVLNRDSYSDYKEAGEWFKKAADQGHEKAREALDELHQQGLA